MSKNASSADNQQGSEHSSSLSAYPSETTRRAPFSENFIKAYFLGALHDGTFSSNRRFRISQKGKSWLKILKKLLKKIRYNSWIYKEGKDRKIYVLETLADFLDFKFNPLELKKILKDLGIETGIIHNPSQKIDPDYWRMYVLTKYHQKFIKTIKSYHPRKINILRKRMMI